MRAGAVHFHGFNLRLIAADAFFFAINFFRATAIALVVMAIIAVPMLMAVKLFILLSKYLSFCSP